MAKRKAAQTSTSPVCFENLVQYIDWPSNPQIHRIHPEQYNGTAFNPGKAGNARFSPIVDANGKAIPTVYGGSSFECAAMETVFHDVPFVAGKKGYDKRKLEGHCYSIVEISQPLRLVDLRAVALRKLGIEKIDLIETTADRYPETRSFAEKIHRECPKAQGLCWVSRQDDSAYALMLFGDRMDEVSLVPVGHSEPLLSNSHYNKILDLADRLDLLFTQGNAI